MTTDQQKNYEAAAKAYAEHNWKEIVYQPGKVILEVGFLAGCAHASKELQEKIDRLREFIDKGTNKGVDIAIRHKQHLNEAHNDAIQKTIDFLQALEDTAYPYIWAGIKIELEKLKI